MKPLLCGHGAERPGRGQGMLEYAMVLALIAIVVIATVSVVGRRTALSICGVSGGLAGNQGVYAATVLGDCPIAYWRFGEPTAGTAHDASGHGNDVTYAAGLAGYGNVPPAATLIYGQPGAILGDSDTAVHTDGSVGNTAALPIPGSGDFSIETWVNLAPFPGTAPFETILLRGEHYDTTGFRFGLRTNRLVFITQDDHGTMVIGTASPSVTTWHQMVATVSGSTVSVYLDGVAAGSGTGTFNRARETVRLGGDEYPMVGLMDDTAVYPIALSPGDVADHYRAAGYALP